MKKLSTIPFIVLLCGLLLSSPTLTAQSYQKQVDQRIIQITQSDALLAGRLRSAHNNHKADPKDKEAIKNLVSFYLFEFGQFDEALKISEATGDKTLDKTLKLVKKPLSEMDAEEIQFLSATFTEQIQALTPRRAKAAMIWTRIFREIYLRRFAEGDYETLKVMIATDTLDDQLKEHGLWPVWRTLDQSTTENIRAWIKLAKAAKKGPKTGKAAPPTSIGIYGVETAEQAEERRKRVRENMNQEKNAWGTQTSNKPDGRSKKKANWVKVKPGMSSIEVYRILGAPNSRSKNHWEYGENPNMFSSDPGKDSGVVYFEKNKVTKVVLPKKIK